MSKRTIGLLTAVVAMAIAGFVGVATATTATCASTDTLNGTSATKAGSAFEIDPNANLIVNTPGCIDWLTGAANTSIRNDVIWKFDDASGQDDYSFGQGTAENNPNPTVVQGSIPPNKSDLKAFGIHVEQNPPSAPQGFLQLFWSRVQNPKGTTNMDFELNKLYCDPDNPTAATCADNGALGATDKIRTPVRSDGDALVTYDLSKGGTVPTISIRFWDTTLNGGDGGWGPADVISSGSNNKLALGSINTSLIQQNLAGGATSATPPGLGSLDPYTFGEASINFEALFPNGTCGSFGSAYLKSRSSDSFTSEIKDFVSPEKVSISNCQTSLTTDATNNAGDNEQPQTVGGTISDSATLGASANGASGNITFKLYKFAANATIGPNDCTAANQVLTYGTSGESVVPVTNHNLAGAGNTTNPYTSASFTTTEVGKYQWVATFNPSTSGLSSSSTPCGDTDEQSIVVNAPSTINTAQSWVPSDTATVSQTGGSVTFTLLKGATVTQTACEKGTYDPSAVVYTSPAQSVTDTTAPIQVSTPTGANGPPAISALNPPASETYRWKAAYSAPPGFDSATSCTETTAININNG